MHTIFQRTLEKKIPIRCTLGSELTTLSGILVYIFLDQKSSARRFFLHPRGKEFYHVSYRNSPTELFVLNLKSEVLHVAHVELFNEGRFP